jgi:hypothetical protein
MTRHPRLRPHSLWGGLVLAGLIALPSLVQATYYVSSSGNDANPGTLAAPFATLQCAVTHLTPGTTLFVRQGTYYGPVSITQSGTSTRFTTMAPWLSVPGNKSTVLLGANWATCPTAFTTWLWWRRGAVKKLTPS